MCLQELSRCHVGVSLLVLLSCGTSWTLIKEPGCSDQIVTLLRSCLGSERPLSPDCHLNPHPGPPRAHRIQSREVGGSQTPPVYDEEREIQTNQTPQRLDFTAERAWTSVYLMRACPSDFPACAWSTLTPSRRLVCKLSPHLSSPRAPKRHRHLAAGASGPC